MVYVIMFQESTKLLNTFYVFFQIPIVYGMFAEDNSFPQQRALREVLPHILTSGRIYRGKPSVLGGESKRLIPLMRIKRLMNNGIWLFAGEGALYNASPSPQGENELDCRIPSCLRNSKANCLSEPVLYLRFSNIKIKN
jgi:hypothetical protein